MFITYRKENSLRSNKIDKLNEDWQVYIVLIINNVNKHFELVSVTVNLQIYIHMNLFSVL